MRSCSGDTRTKVQPRAPIPSSLFLVFLPRISSSSFTEICFDDTRTKVQPCAPYFFLSNGESPSIKVLLGMTREQKANLTGDFSLPSPSIGKTVLVTKNKSPSSSPVFLLLHRGKSVLGTTQEQKLGPLSFFSTPETKALL